MKRAAKRIAIAAVMAIVLALFLTSTLDAYFTPAIHSMVGGLSQGYTYTSQGYKVMRTIDSTTEDTLITGATQLTAPDESDDGTVAFLKPIGAVHIQLIGGDDENYTMSWYLWGYKTASDPAEYIAHGTATTGATPVDASGNYYCDTIVITDQQWLTTVSVINGAPETVVTGGGIAKLALDTNEYQFLKIQIRDIAGGAPEAATAGAKIATIHR